MDMMIFAQMPFGDSDAMQDFLLHNALSHKQVALFFEQNGKAMESYPLEKMLNESDWLQIHSKVHQQEFANLGLTSLPELDNVDLTNEAQFRDWMWEHSLVHQYVYQVLGLMP